MARGSNIMMGYWNAPEETSKVLKNRWYHTGDLGVRDVDGDFRVTGRERDMIKVGIYKVSAGEIEEVLYTCPGVHEAAVIGIPDDDLGEAVRAVIVTEPETVLQAEEIVKFCTARLSAHKVPKEVQFMKALPKNESGKILKRKLPGLFEEKLCRNSSVSVSKKISIA